MIRINGYYIPYHEIKVMRFSTDGRKMYIQTVIGHNADTYDISEEEYERIKKQLDAMCLVKGGE